MVKIRKTIKISKRFVGIMCFCAGLVSSYYLHIIYDRVDSFVVHERRVAEMKDAIVIATITIKGKGEYYDKE